MDKKDKRTTITFDCGSEDLKSKAREIAKSFRPVKISLSDLCQIALKEYVEHQLAIKRYKER